jgi:hypothetical protein
VIQLHDSPPVAGKKPVTGCADVGAVGGETTGFLSPENEWLPWGENEWLRLADKRSRNVIFT